MTKIKILIGLYCLVFFVTGMQAQNNYVLQVRSADKDSGFLQTLGLQTTFSSKFACIDYVNKLPAQLHARGFATASIDSVRYDSSYAELLLFVGEKYGWARLNTSGVEPQLLEQAGWRDNQFEDRPLDMMNLQSLLERILVYLENHGYPFARVYVDSLQMGEGKVSASLKVDKGPLYRIDSIRVYGDLKVSNHFLQQYLEIPAGSIYDKSKLLRISSRLAGLSYMEEERPSNVSMHATGSVLNLYLRQKRASQVNFLVGFLPNNDQLSSKKLLITGDANILLRNALGAGEAIGFAWQQLQVKSPRLNLFYQHPYLFQSPIGLDLAFDMFRKDSSFLNLNLQIGAQYVLSSQQTGKLFLQRLQSIVNNVNANAVLQNRRLPEEADVSSFNIGLDLETVSTDYRFNPRKGNEFRIIGSVGTKKIRKNNQVLDLNDPSEPDFDFESLYDTVKLKTYQFRVTAQAAKYFGLGRQSVIRAGINGGIFQSGNIFRNELFQIGGYKLLRGFDEQSQYVSQYAVASVEYRYLVGRNSFFFAFADGGWGRNNSQQANIHHGYFGTGLGLALETRNSVFNIALAVGKRDDTPMNLRQAKIHFGFVNYF